ncbi:hypothetical protein ACJJTC_015322 [Scirpophaga incertulas]
MDLSKIITKYSVDSEHVLYIHSLDSPVGNVTAVADNDHLFMLSFEDSKNFEKKIQYISNKLHCKFEKGTNKLLLQLEDELSLYFKGSLNNFTIPLKTVGSDFQEDVWKKLRELPYGTTQTYGDIAKSLGRSAAHARAVGAACGANAHLLIIPCHRVVATGSKGGFSCGMDRKEWLIEHENKHRP